MEAILAHTSRKKHLSLVVANLLFCRSSLSDDEPGTKEVSKASDKGDASNTPEEIVTAVEEERGAAVEPGYRLWRSIRE